MVSGGGNKQSSLPCAWALAEASIGVNMEEG